MAFVHAAAEEEVAFYGARLQRADWEDLCSSLMVVLIRLERRYDRTRSDLTFSTYAGQIVRRRVVDWLRQQLGDNRYGRELGKKLVPRGEAAVEFEDGTIEVVDHGRPFDDEVLERLALVEAR